MPDWGVSQTKVTSIRIDPQVGVALEVLNIPKQRVFQRGLIALGLEGKIRDPVVLALVRRRQVELLQDLETEKILLEALENKIKSPAGPEGVVQDREKPLEPWELKTLTRL